MNGRGRTHQQCSVDARGMLRFAAVADPTFGVDVLDRLIEEVIRKLVRLIGAGATKRDGGRCRHETQSPEDRLAARPCGRRADRNADGIEHAQQRSLTAFECGRIIRRYTKGSERLPVRLHLDAGLSPKRLQQLPQGSCVGWHGDLLLGGSRQQGEFALECLIFGG